ncbi:MAG TPA: ATP-binding protein, partial [Acidimicrobiales bacterium]
MAIDPEVVAALEAAVAAEPASIGLRLHLAHVLLDEEPGAALAQVQAVLALAPDNEAALRLAATAAAGAGDPDRAAGYRRVADALGVPPTPEPPRSRAQPVSADLEHEAEIDRFLEEVLGGVDIERPTVRLADVGGLEDVKRRLDMSFLAPMRNPELRRMYGKSLRGGLLLYGPPGCGKTFLARAVAGELGAHFFA